MLFRIFIAFIFMRLHHDIDASPMLVRNGRRTYNMSLHGNLVHLFLQQKDQEKKFEVIDDYFKRRHERTAELMAAPRYGLMEKGSVPAPEPESSSSVGQEPSPIRTIRSSGQLSLDNLPKTPELSRAATASIEELEYVDAIAQKLSLSDDRLEQEEETPNLDQTLSRSHPFLDEEELEESEAYSAVASAPSEARSYEEEAEVSGDKGKVEIQDATLSQFQDVRELEETRTTDASASISSDVRSEQEETKDSGDEDKADAEVNSQLQDERELGEVEEPEKDDTMSASASIPTEIRSDNEEAAEVSGSEEESKAVSNSKSQFEEDEREETEATNTSSIAASEIFEEQVQADVLSEEQVEEERKATIQDPHNNFSIQRLPGSSTDIPSAAFQSIQFTSEAGLLVFSLDLEGLTRVIRRKTLVQRLLKWSKFRAMPPSYVRVRYYLRPEVPVTVDFLPIAWGHAQYALNIYRLTQFAAGSSMRLDLEVFIGVHDKDENQINCVGMRLLTEPQCDSSRLVIARTGLLMTELFK